MLEALKLKRTGVQRGVPDVCVPIPSGIYHGLYLELKRQKGGRVSDEQKEWLDYFNDKGYYAQVANGFEEAKKIVNDYLLFTKNAA